MLIIKMEKYKSPANHFYQLTNALNYTTLRG